MQDLLTFIEHDTVVYPSAVELWNDTVRSYFDDDAYAPDTSVVIRCEDLLFRFDEAMDALKARGLPPRTADTRLESGSQAARMAAQQVHSDFEKLKSDFSSEELGIIAGKLDTEAVAKLQYG